MMAWAFKKNSTDPSLTSGFKDMMSTLFFRLQVNADRLSVSTGARIARSQDRAILEDIVHYYASHVAYNIPVEVFPQPHVMLPVPAPAVLLLAHRSVSLDVPLIGSSLRVMMHDVVINSRMDFYTMAAYVTILSAEVLSNW